MQSFYFQVVNKNPIVMSRCEPRCEEVCVPPKSLNDCANGHLNSFCPPPCMQCCCPSSSPCFSDPCSSGCNPSCDLQCEMPSAACSDPCSKRYEILKHTVKCPSSEPTINCCNIHQRRSSFKPVATCISGGPSMCYQTNYMKSFNNTASCSSASFCCNLEME